MKKYRQLLKRTITEGAIAGALVAACIVLMVVVSGMLESGVQNEAAVQAEVSGVRAQITQQRDRIQSTGVSTKTYESLRAARRTMSIDMNRPLVTDLLATLKERFRLSSLNLQLTPDVAIEDEGLKSAEIKANSSTIQLSFGGMSDQHAFSFIDEFTRAMPGFVRIKTLEVKRSRAFDIEAMRDISRGGKPEMVAGRMDVEWVGVPPKEAP